MKPKHCKPGDIGWNRGKTGYIYHGTTYEEYSKIVKSKWLRCGEGNVLYLWAGTPQTYDILLRSKKEQKLDDFGCSSPPVVWSRDDLPLDMFEVVRDETKVLEN